MITETIRALTIAIEENFPGIYVTNKDLQEGFDRPCFYIDVNDITLDKIGQLFHEECMLTIYYFGKARDSGYLELLKTQKVLGNLLQSGVEVSEKCHVYPVDTVEFNIERSDMVLSAEVTFEVVSGKNINNDIDTTPLMEEIEVSHIGKYNA